jgi:hypothetical protein
MERVINDSRAHITYVPHTSALSGIRTRNLWVSSRQCYTVNIFLARNGRIRAVKFGPKNFGRIFFDLGEISPNQQILRLNNGRNSPKSEKIRPKFLRANLNCADSPGSPEKISTVYRSAECSSNLIVYFLGSYCQGRSPQISQATMTGSCKWRPTIFIVDDFIRGGEYLRFVRKK